MITSTWWIVTIQPHEMWLKGIEMCHSVTFSDLLVYIQFTDLHKSRCSGMVVLIIIIIFWWWRGGGVEGLGFRFCFCIRLAHPLSIQERIYSKTREACIHIVHVLNKKTKLKKKLRRLLCFIHNFWQLKDNNILEF